MTEIESEILMYKLGMMENNFMTYFFLEVPSHFQL